MKRTLAPTLIAAGLLAAACTADDNDAVDDTPTTEVEDETGNGSGDPDDPSESGGGDPDDPDDSGSNGGPTGPIGFAPAALVQFDECSAFLDYVHTEGAERVGAYGFGNNGWFPVGPFIDDVAVMEDDDAMEEAAVDEPAEASASDDSGDFATSAPASADAGRVNQGDTDDGEAGDGSFSTTNVQVEGVDEPDIVKTDGARILAVAGEQLHLAAVSDDGSDATLQSSVRLSNPQTNQWSWGSEILFDGDRAFVIGQSEYWDGRYFEEDVALLEEPIDAPLVDIDDAIDETSTDETSTDETSTDETSTGETSVDAEEPGGDAEAGFAPDEETEPIPVEPDAPIGGPVPPNGYQGPTTVVHEVDLSNPAAISIVNTLEVRGRYVSARQIGSTARVVVTSAPSDLGFVFPSDNNERAIDAATETNQRLVAESELEHWLPTYTLTTSSGTSQGQVVDCSNIHAPAEFSGFDMLSVVTFATDEALGAPTATSSVMATGDTVYASQDRMYISSTVWLPPTIEEQQRGAWEEEYETQIHRFSIGGDGPAAYEASGTVDGHLLNQFSMNDRDGTFFVATTDGTPWGAQADTDNQVIAMQVDGDRLVEVGRVGDLGLEGERIFSVRYVGDLAYLVTFRQTDPFYILDLSDPTNMSVLGELKIPGFSSYLHPISETLVLGVGQDATEEGFTTGTKVSLFDVSDRSNPQEVDVWTLPGGGSDAEFDHRAFLYWPATETAFLPVNQWSENFSGAVALRVNGDGIEELGRITQDDPDTVEPGQTDCRLIEPGTFTEEDGEFFWIAQEGLLLACDEQDQGGATGYFCDAIPGEELKFWTADGELPEELQGIDRIEICWPEGIDWQRQIRRTLVIDGSLWSLSNSRLQANDIVTLAQGDIVELPGI
ncbi:MAG: beta-propeller domain-containing protein [Actinomycetota bacterium]